jgi:Predicted glycosyl hydrolase
MNASTHSQNLEQIMIIHIVQPGDTISLIADKYKTSINQVIHDNGLTETTNLVHGQALVITYPKDIYTVKQGDTLASIAQENGICIVQLIRNNPFLNERNYIFPGETLVIKYDNQKGRLSTNGYVNSFINLDILKKSLPYLTFLTVFGNRIADNGNIIEVDGDHEIEIIKTAKEYHVVPIMMLSTLNIRGIGSIDQSYDLVYNEQNVDYFIKKVISILDKKGYKGINLTFQFLNEASRPYYEKTAIAITKSLNRNGYLAFVTISENFVYEGNYITFEQIEYKLIGEVINGVTLLNFNWGVTYGPPKPVESVGTLIDFINYVNTKIPYQKAEIGITTIGYDWELPYVPGVTVTKSLSIASAINLADNVGAIIQFDEVSHTPYFRYYENKNGILRQHIVWFIDARTVEALLDMISSNGNRGAAVWNIMNYFPQLWTILNSQYEIETLI